MPPKNNLSSLWTLRDVWNETLDSNAPRVLTPRNYIYASELGKSYCDRYLKMNGVKPTNPPNTRSLRKFQAGEAWEWIVGIVLISAGMLKNKQIRVEAKLPRLARVSGRLDYVVGSPANYQEAKDNIKRIQDGLELLGIGGVPPFFFKAIDKFIDNNKGVNFSDVITEVKTVSSFMMDKIQKTGVPMPHHTLQNFHYVFGNEEGINTGKLLYICKDDCIMEEFNVFNNEENLEMYRADIKKMSKYYAAGFDPKNPTDLMPPLEPLVVFEEGTWRFSKNWNVEYSDYLKLLYGYETPEAYRMGWQYKVSSWNRVFKRCVKGDNMTPKNIEVIKEASKMFPKWDRLVAAAKADGAFQTEEEEVEE